MVAADAAVVMVTTVVEAPVDDAAAVTKEVVVVVVLVVWLLRLDRPLDEGNGSTWKKQILQVSSRRLSFISVHMAWHDTVKHEMFAAQNFRGFMILIILLHTIFTELAPDLDRKHIIRFSRESNFR